MDFTSVVLGLIFMAAGIAFAMGEIHPRLTAWKNMPEEDKANINIVPLCRNIGDMIALCGGLFVIRGVWNGFSPQMFTVFMVIWFAAAFLDLIYIEKSPRYRKA